MPEVDTSKCSIVTADITEYKKIPFTHIYCFDYVFSDETHQKLFPILAKSKFKCLLTFCNPKKVQTFGDFGFVEIGSVRVRTTGGQTMTGHFYTNIESKEK